MCLVCVVHIYVYVCCGVCVYVVYVRGLVCVCGGCVLCDLLKESLEAQHQFSGVQDHAQEPNFKRDS